jgi:hypothetical protein
MPMFSRLNYYSIVTSYHQFRKRYFSKHLPLIVAGVFLSCIGLSLFLIAQSVKDKNALAQKNINDEATPSFVPLPTEIDPNFLYQVNSCFIPVATVYGYNLRISSGFRTVIEQEQLYHQGRADNGDIITEAPGGKSIHNFGFAVDVVDRKREYNINWERLAKIGAYCGLEPGDENDLPHFEYRGGLTTEDFIAGKRPSPLTIPCAIMDERVIANQQLTLKDLQNCGIPKF